MGTTGSQARQQSNFRRAMFAASASSGRQIEASDHLPVVGDLVFTDRDYRFTSLGDFAARDMRYVRAPNDDKNVPANSVMWTLHAPGPVTLYLDFWGGNNHCRMQPWLQSEGWARVDMAGCRFGSYGPGIVFQKSFPGGRIQLLGNNGDGHGTFVVFVDEGTDKGVPRLEPALASEGILAATAASGRPIRVQPGSPTVGDAVFTDRDYRFTSLGSFAQMDILHFVVAPNDDKNVSGSQVMWSLFAPWPVMVYLDHWGGEPHVKKHEDWLIRESWERCAPDEFAGVSFTHPDYGPGFVYKKDFREGRIDLLGNNGCNHGAYLVFVKQLLCTVVSLQEVPLESGAVGISCVNIGGTELALMDMATAVTISELRLLLASKLGLAEASVRLVKLDGTVASRDDDTCKLSELSHRIRDDVQ